MADILEIFDCSLVVLGLDVEITLEDVPQLIQYLEIFGLALGLDLVYNTSDLFSRIKGLNHANDITL